jgi:hypothetical protein
MSSDRRKRANQRNAKRSSGPKTPEGKAASAGNATTHGLTSAFSVLPHEDPSAFQRLLEKLAKEFTPGTEHEKFLVDIMAQSRWRLERTRRFEDIAFEQMFGEVDMSDPDHMIVVKLTNRTTNIIDLLQRYATAAERSYFRAHRELTQSRNREKRNEANAAQIWLKQQLEQTRIPNDPFLFEPDDPAESTILPNEPTSGPGTGELDAG